MNVDQLWGAAKPMESTGGEVPDGKYVVRVEKCVRKSTKAGDKEMIAWDFVVTEGEHAGRHIFNNRVINPANPEQSMSFIKTDFDRIGLGEESNLQDAIQKSLDRVIEVQVKTNGQYTNVYVNKLIGAGKTDPDLPF